MNKYNEKAEKIRQHLNSHPHDYESVVSLFKTESKAIDYEKKLRMDKQKALIAEYRREHEKHT